MDRRARTISALHLLFLSLLAPPHTWAQADARWRVPAGSLATSTILWRLDSACTAGALPTCDTLGMHHWSTRDKQERKLAAELWQRTCSAGGVGACANLAMAFDDGEGVKKDRRKAFTLAREACDSGSAPACVVVASMLSDGRAGQKDLAAGAAMMERACTMTDLYACLNMTYRTLDGSFGVTRDTTRARAFAAQACSAVVPDHPYPWYRAAAGNACTLARQLAAKPD
jgi:TPR repeat protein